MPRLRHLLTLTLGTALLHLPSVQAAEELPAAIKQIEAKGAKSSASSTPRTACAAMRRSTRTVAWRCT